MSRKHRTGRGRDCTKGRCSCNESARTAPDTCAERSWCRSVQVEKQCTEGRLQSLRHKLIQVTVGRCWQQAVVGNGCGPRAGNAATISSTRRGRAADAATTSSTRLLARHSATAATQENQGRLWWGALGDDMTGRNQLVLDQAWPSCAKAAKASLVWPDSEIPAFTVEYAFR